ncbi:MAG: YfiR family protein [Burkholderiales bacterium]|nr:YfiR family protein [Burkholderiales bacterium]
MFFFGGQRRPRAKMLMRWLASLTCLFLCSVVVANTTLSKEEKLKAAYILNFTKFMEWPVPEVGEAASDIRICTDSSADFIVFFNKMAANVKIGKMKKNALALSLDAARNCELIYVTKINSPYRQVGKHVVVVADRNEISYPNISVLFFEKGKKLRFEINQKSISHTRVTVSSELLKIARVK